ncbi:uncharacterized protein LOC118511224 [Anopheles stephensi]|uniref:uncharacterized protein LOC118511224 n=1 Tax=Anopheles stephensi TaxID=30069 RepID=UPI001658AC2B|nr:uncharacterized protein LOC118511224 [Anopheles stephensi]XP_035909940.1 uncharacterized protein LOC118511224 [Anopheles stephensi]XP_035909942.1 uncharacterized protein LOC118511224 [Anopheles stephensi]
MPSAPDRNPDYYIGATGRPVLTTHFTTMGDRHGLSKSENGARNSKLHKCLYNLTVRNGGGTTFPTGNNAYARHGSIVASSRRASNKTEHDITAIPRHGHLGTGGRSSKSPPHQISGSTRDAGRSSFGASGGWYSTGTAGTHSGLQTDRSRSSTSPSPSRLLTARSTTRRSGPPEVSAAESSLVLQCRYHNQHKLLDNRLTNQRSYDRNIFGYDRRMDQFVLPPLQI